MVVFDQQYLVTWDITSEATHHAKASSEVTPVCPKGTLKTFYCLPCQDALATFDVLLDLCDDTHKTEKSDEITKAIQKAFAVLISSTSDTAIPLVATKILSCGEGHAEAQVFIQASTSPSSSPSTFFIFAELLLNQTLMQAYVEIFYFAEFSLLALPKKLV